MKEVLVISGKGGTGKTSIVGAVTVLVDNLVRKRNLSVAPSS